MSQLSSPQLDVNCSPNFRKFIETKLTRHYLLPVRDLMQQPRTSQRKEIHFDFAIANTLLSLVSGVSALVYPRSWNPGDKFKTLLEQHYPWTEEPSTGTVGSSAASIIYKTFRNPLAHALGIEGGSKLVVFKRRFKPAGASKRGYYLRELAMIEKSPARPSGWSATLTESPTKIVLLLDGFYWGCHRMVESVSRDTAAMQRAEGFLGSVKHW
jgi:hypothetical protein